MNSPFSNYKSSTVDRVLRLKNYQKHFTNFYISRVIIKTKKFIKPGFMTSLEMSGSSIISTNLMRERN